MNIFDFLFGRNITLRDETVLRDIFGDKRRTARQTERNYVPVKRRAFSPMHKDELEYERAVKRVNSETSKAFGWSLNMPLEYPKKLKSEQLAKLRETIDALEARDIIKPKHAGRIRKELEDRLNAD